MVAFADEPPISETFERAPHYVIVKLYVDDKSGQEPPRLAETYHSGAAVYNYRNILKNCSVIPLDASGNEIEAKVGGVSLGPALCSSRTEVKFLSRDFMTRRVRPESVREIGDPELREYLRTTEVIIIYVIYLFII